MSISKHVDFFQTDRLSLLNKSCLRKSIWREAMHEQKESLEETILRMHASKCRMVTRETILRMHASKCGLPG